VSFFGKSLGSPMASGTGVVLLFEERSITLLPVALKTASINVLCTLPRLASEFGIFSVNPSFFSDKKEWPQVEQQEN
jgi:hypothetical protein